MAETLKVLWSLKYADATPSSIVAELQKIDRALTSALQVLLPLALQHHEGQDLEKDPFNWLLVQALRDSRMTMEIMRLKGPPPAEFEVPAYPTGVIDELIVLRDAARSAAVRLKPGRGNSSARSARTALIDAVGKNFVFSYRSRFEQMPPITKTGWVVDLLREALVLAGADGADAADVLRRAIEKDEVGRTLLPSAKGKPAWGSGPKASTSGRLKRRRKD